MRSFCLLALAVFLVVRAPHEAHAGREWYEGLVKKYATGDPATLESLADTTFLKRASKDATGWAYLCESIWFFQPHVSRIHPDDVGPALQAVVAYAATVREAEEGSRAATLAWGYTTIALCRHRIHTGFTGAQPAWIEAADALSSKAEDSSRLFKVAAQALLEATVCKGADVEALTTRSRAALRGAIGLIEEPAIIGATRAGWHADAARAELARKKKGPAKKSIARGLEALVPYLDSDSHPGEIATARTELVLLDHKAKLKVKGAEFRWISRRSKTGGLVVEIPVTDVWLFQELQDSERLCFVQLTPSRARLRYFVLEGWPTGTALSMPDGTTAATTDPKKLALASAPTLPDILRFSDVERQSKPKKARLHKSLSDAYMVEIEGTRNEELWTRVRVYFFKSKATKHTYRFYYFESEKDPVQDGMLELVLSKLRVAKKGR